jgi:hypothetical protein
MYGLKTKLENRIRRKFYGSSLNSNLRKMSKNDKIKFENSANLAYDRALKYLTERFDLQGRVF